MIRACITLIFASCSTVVLLLAAASTDFDRTYFLTKVSFRGPLAALMPELSYVGWGLSCVAIIFAIASLNWTKMHRRALTYVGLTLAIANLVIGLLYTGANLVD